MTCLFEHDLSRDFMSKNPPITCKPTNWFNFRVIAMFAMFTIFAIYFAYDWKFGYRKKNLVHHVHKEFEKAGAKRMKIETAEAWSDYAKDRNFELEKLKDVLPADVKLPMEWPESLKTIGKESDANNWLESWKAYSDTKGWDSNPPKKSHDAKSIQEQLYWGIGSGLLGLIPLFFFLRTTQRSMRVDDEAYYDPSGKRIPFTDIKKIDKRKWDTKGLAYLFYDEDGSEKKVKVDGLVYGQFKEEDGAPAEALFKRILDNFSGELIELAPEEEDEDEEALAEESIDSKEPNSAGS